MMVRRASGRPRATDPPARVWRDWALVGTLVPVAVLEGALRPDLPWRDLSVAVVLGLIPTVLWRRNRPLLMVVIAFATTTAATLAAGGAAPQLYTTAFVLLLPYALLRWASTRDAAIGSVIMLTATTLSIAVDDATTADAIGGFVVLFAATSLGVTLRYRATSREQALEHLRLLERERLARDLHDTVAHHVSAIAISAQAGLATAPTRPEAATEALRMIEAEASRALAEMRAMVRILRRGHPADAGATDQAGPEDLAPSPRLTDLAQLAGRSDGGPAVSVDIAHDVGALAPSTDAAIYRLAQEAVTNALRHARHATRIEVRVAADDRAVRLTVHDDGDSSPLRASSPGFGLVGMIERAELLGGTCVAGPNPDRGWTVTAALPRTSGAR